jgi:hypothetical protein
MIRSLYPATWQRCQQNVLLYQWEFIQPDRETAGQVWRHVADQLRPRFEKLGRLMDEAEHDVLAYMTFIAVVGGALGAAFGV